MTDQARLQAFMAAHGASAEDVAALWGSGLDDVLAVLEGNAAMTGRHVALLVLFGGGHKTARTSALKHLRAGRVGPEWRPIPGFSKYEASAEGDIRRRVGGSGASPLRVLRATARPDDYLRVTLYDDTGKMVTKQVHRLICLAFHGPAEGRYACHRDGERRRNAEGNLYWGTAKENALDRVAHEAADPDRKFRKSGDFAGTEVSQRRVRQLYRAGKITRNKALELLAVQNI